MLQNTPDHKTTRAASNEEVNQLGGKSANTQSAHLARVAATEEGKAAALSEGKAAEAQLAAGGLTSKHKHLSHTRTHSALSTTVHHKTGDSC